MHVVILGRGIDLSKRMRLTDVRMISVLVHSCTCGDLLGVLEGRRVFCVVSVEFSCIMGLCFRGGGFL